MVLLSEEEEKYLRVGDLFAGIGGFSLGLERAGMQVVWQVEKDEFCRKVLEKHWPKVKRYEDIRECGAHNLEPVDLICGGFPCQPFSKAGKRRGSEDDRNLWPEMCRVIQELKPTWIIGENVIGFDGLGLDAYIDHLEAIGYDVAPPFEISATAVGLQTMEWHTWIIATAVEQRRKGGEKHPNLQDGNERKFPGSDTGEYNRRDISQTRFCRVAERVSGRLERHQRDRLRALGNAVIPQIVEIIGRIIMTQEGK